MEWVDDCLYNFFLSEKLDEYFKYEVFPLSVGAYVEIYYNSSTAKFYVYSSYVQDDVQESIKAAISRVTYMELIKGESK